MQKRSAVVTVYTIEVVTTVPSAARLWSLAQVSKQRTEKFTVNLATPNNSGSSELLCSTAAAEMKKI